MARNKSEHELREEAQQKARAKLKYYKHWRRVYQNSLQWSANDESYRGTQYIGS